MRPAYPLPSPPLLIHQKEESVSTSREGWSGRPAVVVFAVLPRLVFYECLLIVLLQFSKFLSSVPLSPIFGNGLFLFLAALLAAGQFDDGGKSIVFLGLWIVGSAMPGWKMESQRFDSGLDEFALFFRVVEGIDRAVHLAVNFFELLVLVLPQFLLPFLQTGCELVEGASRVGSFLCSQPAGWVFGLQRWEIIGDGCEDGSSAIVIGGCAVLILLALGGPSWNFR